MSKAKSIEQEVKVEWDPERYEESMAAIRAWVPERVKVELIRNKLIVEYRSIHTFTETGSSL